MPLVFTFCFSRDFGFYESYLMLDYINLTYRRIITGS